MTSSRTKLGTMQVTVNHEHPLAAVNQRIKDESHLGAYGPCKLPGLRHRKCAFRGHHIQVTFTHAVTIIRSVGCVKNKLILQHYRRLLTWAASFSTSLYRKFQVTPFGLPFGMPSQPPGLFCAYIFFQSIVETKLPINIALEHKV